MNTIQWLAVAMLAVLGVTEICASGGLFLCERDGKRVFANRALEGCRAFAVSNSNVAESASSRNEPAVKEMACASSSAVANELLRIKQRCRDLRNEMDELAALLRDSHTAQQGRRANQRLDELEAQFNVERCRLALD